MITTTPVPLGLKRSFGFGDRLGVATPGHCAAVRAARFAPIFAQQSIREMERTQRTPTEVMAAAVEALTRLGYAGEWGADADHLKLPEHVDRTAAAGFCFFTIDPSAYVGRGILTAELESLYLGKKFEVPGLGVLPFDRPALHAAAVKYARALEHVAQMGEHIARTMGAQPFEIEVSVDETETPTSSLEHFFIGAELKRRGVPHVVSVAPRFIGEFEKGVDYKGDLTQFETALGEHIAIAKHWGPYKLSIHSGSDKFAVYPIIGRVCGDLLHVKTAGTSYLEALRVVARTHPTLFGKITQFSRERFAVDCLSYHISATTEQVANLPVFKGLEERQYLDELVGRQMLHVTFGSVLTHPEFKSAILETLTNHTDLHVEFLLRHLGKHLKLLSQG